MKEKLIRLLPRNEELAFTRPRAADYAQIYGLHALIPEQWFDGSIEPYRNTEEVYAACIEKGVTWEELLDYKPREDITM